MPAKSHDSVAVIGIDLGKNVFHLIAHAASERGWIGGFTSAGSGQS